MSDGIEATVPPTIRETVEAVKTLQPITPDGVSIMQVAKHLKLDKSAASRRVAGAIERGYLTNLEDRKGKPSRLVLADPLPDDLVILPEPTELNRLLQCCSVVEGDTAPPSPRLHNVDHDTCAECGRVLYDDMSIQIRYCRPCRERIAR